MSRNVIRMAGVSKSYQMGEETVHALRGMDLEVEENEYIAIIGSSGSGKSTLMNILGCLETADAGAYHLRGREIANMGDDDLARVRNREIGFVFQSFNLLPRQTALQNVMQPLVYRGTRRAEREELAREALAKVGLSGRAGHLPQQLSGGQRQRVAIARALCGQPSLLLADEPTGNLDKSTTAEIMALFDELHARGNTLILVTHDQEIASRCQRNITLSDGAVVSDQAPAAIVRSASKRESYVAVD